MNHALIRLREELLILKDTWRHVNGDASFPDQTNMLAQISREMREVKQAIDVLSGATYRAEMERRTQRAWASQEARAA